MPSSAGGCSSKAGIGLRGFFVVIIVLHPQGLDGEEDWGGAVFISYW